MKFNTDDAFIKCGNKHKYQIIVLIAIIFTWFSLDFISLTFPLLELEPKFECKIGKNFIECDIKDACKLNESSRNPIIEYKNILTEYKLECNKIF